MNILVAAAVYTGCTFCSYFPQYSTNKKAKIATFKIFFFFCTTDVSGEVLGRAEVFYFLLSLVHRFRIVSGEAGRRLDFEAVPGVTFHPRPFRVRLEPRKGRRRWGN